MRIGNVASTFNKKLCWVKIKVVIDCFSFFYWFWCFYFRFQKESTHVTFLPGNGTIPCILASTSLKKNSKFKKSSLKNIILWYKVTVKKLNTLSQSFYTKQNQWKLFSCKSFPDNSRCLFLLFEIFSLVLMAEFSALKILFMSQKYFFQLLLLINWFINWYTSLLPMFNC